MTLPVQYTEELTVVPLTQEDLDAMTGIQIEEHIQKKVEKIQEKKIAAEGRLRRAISFLFNCESDNPYNLHTGMKARLYL